MLTVFPDYYKDFECIKGACRHNCCIGWEIDIDDDTLAFYDTVNGEMGERLCKNICRDENPHFILGCDERCPFLNKDNLCDIIITLGKERLCGICADHPRFRNELPDRVEVGLGLCCEAAAKLIFCKETPTTLVYSGEKVETEDEIIILRDKVIAVLQNRDLTLEKRFDAVLNLCGITMPEIDFSKWSDIFLGLERLDSDWTVLLNMLKSRHKAIENRNIQEQACEYEQLAVYFIYRHFANAPDLQEAALRAAFAVFGCRLIYTIYACLCAEKGTVSIDDFIEIARLFSSEIEYSDENLYIILDELWEEIGYGKAES